MAGPDVRGGEREQVARRLGVARLDQRLERVNRFVVPAERDQHPAEIESGDPERRLALGRPTVLVGCGLERALALEDLSEVVVRLRVPRVDRDRLPVGVRRGVPLLLQPEQHAVVVVRVAEIEAERHDGTVVFVGLRPVARAAVERDQIGVRLRDRRIARERLFVRRNRARQIAFVGQPDPALERRLRIVSERRHAGEHRVGDRRPPRAVARVLLEGALGRVPASERAIRERERVVRRAVFGEERDGALEVRHGGVVSIARGRDSTEPEFRDRFGRRLAPQGVVERLGAIEIARVEQRLGQLRAGRHVVGSAAQRFVEGRGGVRVTREPLQRDTVEVQPFGGPRRQRLRAQVGVVRRAPLIPRVQRARERADGGGIGRARHRGRVRARDRVARRRRKSVEGDLRKRGKRGLRGSECRRADAKDSLDQKLNLSPRRIWRSG